MREGILRVGGELLAQDGVAGLSVREIARGLGVASSALYRHVASRDELLTLLLEDAFTDLAGRVDETVGHDVGHAGLAALAGAMRGWAVEQPQRWALVYGSPVPGYAAPAERTTGPGTRVMACFLGILAQGGGSVKRESSGQEESSGAGEGPELSPGYASLLASGADELGVQASPMLTAAAVEAWTGLVGLISAEVFGQLGSDFAAFGDEMLQRWVDTTAQRFGLASAEA